MDRKWSGFAGLAGLMVVVRWLAPRRSPSPDSSLCRASRVRLCRRAIRLVLCAGAGALVGGFVGAASAPSPVVAEVPAPAPCVGSMSASRCD